MELTITKGAVSDINVSVNSTDVTVQQANNILVEVTPTPSQTINIDRGVTGIGIQSIQIVEIDGIYYFDITYTNGSTELVELPPIASGVTSFNTRTGAVTLIYNDVTGALGFTPAHNGANSDITSLSGITGGISSPDFVQIDTSATATIALGKLRWNPDTATASFGIIDGTVECNIGEQVYAYVTNADSVTIQKGQPVYLYRATGNRASVKLAGNLGDATSAKTLGLATQSIAPNQTGFVTTQGVLDKIDTSAFAEGDTLYLGATAGTLTNVKPKAPNHLVYIGVVERANAGNGQIYVKPQNGYELDELHDVQINSPSNGQTILYDASTSLWKNANLTAGTGISVTNGSASATITNTAPDQVVSLTGTGSTTVTGTYPNFTINSTSGSGTVTSVAATGGTGISVTGSPITTSGTLNIVNTAPDQTVVMNSGTGISVTGTYPNFTVTNTAPSSGGTVTSVNGTAPVVSSGGTTPTISMTKATGSVDGYLSSTDWNTFNNKTSNTGTVTSVSATAGTGISITGSPITTSGTLNITNTAPDQIVSLTAGSNVTVTGTYPNFTISATGGGGGGGTVTSVDMTVPTGLSITGNPITTSGTLALTYASGYSIPTTTSQGNWDTAYTDRLKWDGGSTGLVASTGRTSLGASTLGSNIFTITNPSAVTFPRFNADNTISALTASDFRTAIGAGTGSGTVTSVSGTAPILSTGGTTPAISISQASSTTDGYLSSTDWNTFNNKGSGTVTSVNGTGTVSGISLSGTVTSSGNLTLGGALDLSAPPTIGNTTPSTGKFTTLESTGTASLGTTSAQYIQAVGDATYPQVKAAGSGTNIPLVLQPKGTGALQAQLTDSTATGGNARGANAVDWQTSRSTASFVASGQASVIGGGTGNTASAFAATIAGGASNLANNSYAFIGAGSSNTANLYSVIGGGASNTAAGFYNIVVGGYVNAGTSTSAVTTQATTTVTSGSTAVTLSGSNASIKVGQYVVGTGISGNTYVAAISGTSLTLSQNAASSGTPTLSFYTPHGVVVGGGNNQATGSYSFIGGGGDAGTAANRNVASGDWAFVGGGKVNQATQVGSVVVGGGVFAGGQSGNTSSGASSFVGAGLSNSASNNYAFVGAGNANTANGIMSFIGGGNQGNTRSVDGYHAFPACNVPIAASSGVSQGGLLVLAVQTTDATATILRSNTSAAGTSNQIIMPNNSAYLFKCTVIAGVTGAGNTSAWKLEGAIKRGATAGSTAIVGTVTTTLLAQDVGAATWAVTATADTTNGGLKITVTGQAATTIRWVCKVETTEMTY